MKPEVVGKITATALHHLVPLLSDGGISLGPEHFFALRRQVGIIFQALLKLLKSQQKKSITSLFGYGGREQG